jgi:ElaB/YqjD/DUF883 family membrane-anchored ribosome-binding protein
MAQEMMKDAKNVVAKEVSALKAKAEASPIREDLETIREDVRVLSADAKTLGHDIKIEGRKHLNEAGERARDAMATAKERGRDHLSEALTFVQNNPGQSIAFAFVGGMIVSLLLGRRS